jgi:hypothetical protein
MAQDPEQLVGYAKVIARYGDHVLFLVSPGFSRYLENGQIYDFDGNGDPNPWMESEAICLANGPHGNAVFLFEPSTDPNKGAGYFTPGKTNHIRLNVAGDKGSGTGGGY